MAQKQDRFGEHGVKLAAISYDSIATLKAFAEEAKLTFPLLSDEKSEAIAAFGILNESHRKGHKWHGVPYPYVFLIGRDGRVLGKFWEDRYQDRPTPESILQFVEAKQGRTPGDEAR